MRQLRQRPCRCRNGLHPTFGMKLPPAVKLATLVKMDDHFGNGGVIWGSMSAIMIMGNTIAMENGEVERMAL